MRVCNLSQTACLGKYLLNLEFKSGYLMFLYVWMKPGWSCFGYDRRVPGVFGFGKLGMLIWMSEKKALSLLGETSDV
jgi:hypothetical protein